MKKALIIGVSGQDGAYLSHLLLQKGYKVYGTSRDAQMSNFSNLKLLRIYDQINFESMSIIDFRSVLQIILKIEPDEIYNLAGQTSVGLSFDQPVETMESIIIGTLNILEAIRLINNRIKFYNAGSSECFGDTNGKAADENTLFKPLSPYAVAKSAAFWQVNSYRISYNLFAVTGILFNHESSLRHKKFVTKKIISTACRIANGSSEKLELGNLDIERDWGWAPEYVEAMWLMLQKESPDDFVIATGQTNSLKTFVSMVFNKLNLNWEEYVIYNQNFERPAELKIGSANPSKAHKELNWKAKASLKDIVDYMVADELKYISNE